MNALIIGFGEVGKAHWENLKGTYPNNLYYKDIGPEIYNTRGESVGDLVEPVDIMMIATQCDPKNMGKFELMVAEYDTKFCPKIIDILTTTPPGTAERIQEIVGDRVKVAKSTVRGTHPNLNKFKCIPKHIGGPGADTLKEFYEACGWGCITHETSRATELFHILNNIWYGANVMMATEAARYCRYFAVDYMEFLKYRESNNNGFIKAGYPSRVSPILYPADKQIGGHCVVYASTTIPESELGPIAKLLKEFNK